MLRVDGAAGLLRVFSESKMASFISVISDAGKEPSSKPLLELRATNPESNQPVLRISQASKRGGAASIRIDDPNPDIEFVETCDPESEDCADRATPGDLGKGKFEIAVQSDRLQINGRNKDGNGFDTIAVFQRPDAGANVAIGFRRAQDIGDCGGAVGAVILHESEKPPTRNVSAAGVLYVENGALKFRGAQGTVTVLAPA